MQIKKEQLELDREQQTGSKLGKEYIKDVHCITYIQSTSCEMPGWMEHKLESILPGEISITSDTQMTTHLRQNVKLFSSSSLSSIRVVSTAYLRLLIFILAILIPAFASSSLTFLMMYPTNKLHKQGDNIQP